MIFSKLIRILLVFSYSTIASALIAQEIEQYQLHQQALKFTDGVYTNIGMVEKNSPIPSTWIVTDMDVNDRNFYNKLTRADEIEFYDDNGVRTLLNTKRIWGYCYNGNLHINVGGAFHKIDFVGRISHFFASKTTYYPNPLLGSYSTLSFWSSKPILITSRNEEYLVDILENKVHVFDVDGLERTLKNDPQLWNEFSTLKKQEKERLKYIFLKRYNAKYPLDIPFD